jgi:hypothetical protein
MRRRLTISTVALLLCAGAGGIAGGKTAKQADPEEPPSFARDVMPVLGRYCENCHGDKEQHGGLRLDNYDNLMRGGDSGPAIVAGNARKSLLIAKIEHRDQPSMPPRKWLPKPAIARIKAWVTAGAEP